MSISNIVTRYLVHLCRPNLGLGAPPRRGTWLEGRRRFDTWRRNTDVYYVLVAEWNRRADLGFPP